MAKGEGRWESIRAPPQLPPARLLPLTAVPAPPTQAGCLRASTRGTASDGQVVAKESICWVTIKPRAEAGSICSRQLLAFLCLTSNRDPEQRAAGLPPPRGPEAPRAAEPSRTALPDALLRRGGSSEPGPPAAALTASPHRCGRRSAASARAASRPRRRPCRRDPDHAAQAPQRPPTAGLKRGCGRAREPQGARAAPRAQQRP